MQPPRLATAAQAKRIRHFYYWTNLGSEFFVWLLGPVVVLFGFTLVVNLLTSDAFVDRYLTSGVHIAMLAAFYGWRVWRRRQRAAHALAAYRLGRAVPIYLVSMTENWGTKINGRPRSIITLRKENELLVIKTFDSTVINAYGRPSQLAYVLDAYPDIVLPASVVDAPDDNDGPRLPVREVSI